MTILRRVEKVLQTNTSQTIDVEIVLASETVRHFHPANNTCVDRTVQVVVILAIIADGLPRAINAIRYGNRAVKTIGESLIEYETNQAINAVSLIRARVALSNGFNTETTLGGNRINVIVRSTRCALNVRVAS